MPAEDGYRPGGCGGRLGGSEPSGAGWVAGEHIKAFRKNPHTEIRHIDARSEDKIEGCALHGKVLKGKVQIVDSFPDFKVQAVTSFPDLKVMLVESFPDDCGEWQIVESFPDFTIQYVTSFPDFKIQMVTSFPGEP